MLRTTTLLALIAGALAITGCACSLGGNGCSVTSTSSAQAGAVAGNLAVLDDITYPNGIDCGTDYQILNGPDTAAQDFAKGMQGKGWKVTDSNGDQRVTGADFYSNENVDDAIFYAGHGLDGLFVFSNYCNTSISVDQRYWGVGNDQNGISNETGIPVSGSRLKWLFALSSNTAAGPAAFDPSDNLHTAEWEAAFTQNELHGLYGFWEGPVGSATCGDSDNDSPQRACDAEDQQFPTVATTLANTIYNPGGVPATVHSAWVNATNTAGIHIGWGIWEDQANVNDTFTGPGGISNNIPSGTVLYYWGGPSGTVTTNPIAVASTSFTLAPAVTTPESINDQTIVNEVQPYVSNISETNTGQAITLSQPGGASVLHNYASSGAIAFFGVPYFNTLGFSASTALNAAEGFLQASLGIPSDAVLSSTDANYVFNPRTASTTVTGYTFVWHHNSPALGDEIAVVVDDDTTTTRACTGGYKLILNPPGHPISVCQAWTTTVTHKPNISYALRQWHAPVTASSTVRNIESAGRSTGSPSIDAYTASLSLPPGTVVTAYTSGYWYGNGYDTTVTAEPAWLFTVGGSSIVAVDAFSGALLGERTL